MAMAPTRDSTHHWENELVTTLFAILVISAASQPGIFVGVVVAAAWWTFRAPPLWVRSAAGIIGLTGAVAGLAAIAWAWPWRLVMPHIASGYFWPPQWTSPTLRAGPSIAVEALAGPAWLFAWSWVWSKNERSPGVRIDRERKRQEKRRQRIEAAATTHSRHQPPPEHPAATIRLGIDIESRKPVDLELPADLGQHITILGKIGTGKTTTAARLTEGVVLAGWPVVIIDAKGFGSLRAAATSLAARAGVPLHLLAPDDPASLAYNPCRGTPAQISNKLVGAFTWGAEAEIYKQISQEVISVLMRAGQLTDAPVSISWLHAALNPHKMNGLAVSIGDRNPALRALVADLGNRGNLYTNAYAGMRARLGALLQGEYGPILEPDAEASQLNLADSFSRPSITYISLPVLSSSEDVELMARVLAQDIKQVAASRIGRGEQPPALLVLDEFAGLREADQLNDLLLQAREARIACAVSTQFLPHADQASALRHALMGSGTFLTHQCSPVDIDDVAGIFGTRKTIDATQQIDYATGYSEKGSFRRVRQFRVEPDDLRDLPRGVAAIRVEPTGRRIALVKVHPAGITPTERSD